MKNLPFAFPSNDDGSIEPGMNLRDWFAAHAPQPTDRWIKDSQGDGHHVVNADAAWRYFWADAMLAERDKERVDDNQDLRDAVQSLLNEIHALGSDFPTLLEGARESIESAKRALINCPAKMAFHP